MNFTLRTKLVNTFRNLLLLLIAYSVFACQQTEETDQTEAANTVTAVDTTAVRPAPTFYVIPPDLAEKRVWICENASFDIFHVQHDCPLLAECKGKGGFRNLTLIRAIEDYGRYNCHICSEELAHIFDEDVVR